MEQQSAPTISQLIEEAKKANKTIVLIGGCGAGMDAHNRMLVQAAEILKGQEFIIVDVGSLGTKDILAHAQNLPKDRGIVIIEDLNERFMRESRENIVFRLEAMDYELKDITILSDQKKEYGVSKNKKSFSPPKHKGYIQPKFVLRGRHR